MLSPFDPQFRRCESVHDCFLVSNVEFGTKCEKRGDALDDLAEPFALIVGKGLAVAPIRLSIAEPLLQDRIATELAGPHAPGRVGE